MTGVLAATMCTLTFHLIHLGDPRQILDDHRHTAYWASRFGGQLPPPNPGQTPVALAPEETVYVGKLLEVYSETDRSGDCMR